MPSNFVSQVWKVFGSVGDAEGVEAYGQRSQIMENWYRRQNRLVSRLGTQKIATLESNGTVDGLQWNRITSGGISTEYLLTVYNGDIRNAFTDVTTAVTSGANRCNSTGETNMAWVDNRVVIGNGLDQNVYFDGSQVYQAMPDIPATGMVAGWTLPPSGSLQAGVYKYAVTIVNQAGDYTQPTLALPVTGVTVPSNFYSVSISGIPTAPAGQDSTGRQIWRTDANGGVYFLVATISDNTTTTYVDTTSDNDLGLSQLLFENTRLPPCRYLCEWQNRVVGAGCLTAEGDNQTLYISNVRQPWYCPLLPNIDTPDNPDPNQGAQLRVQDRSGAGWTGLTVHGGILVAFTGGAGHIVTPNRDGTFFVQIFTSHGCASHRTLISAKSMLFWLSWDGLYMWDGNQAGDNVTRISDEAYNTLIAENSSNLGKANAFFFDNRYYLNLPDRTLVYDTIYKQWNTIVNPTNIPVWSWGISTTTVYTSDQKPRIYAAPVNLGQIWQAEVPGLYTDGGQPIPLRWRSGDTDFGQSGPIPTQWPSMYFPAGGERHEKRLIFIGANYKAAVGQSATINIYRGTGQTIPLDTITWDLGQTVDQEVVVPVGDSQVSRYWDRAGEGARDEFFAIETVIDATAPIELLQAELHCKICK